VEVYRDIVDLRHFVADRKRRGNRIVFVPTMGALHDGHGACVRRGRSVENGTLVVSIYVNPTQFGPGEDLDKYPKTLEADLDLCRNWGVDAVFTPRHEDVYPADRPGPVWVVVEELTKPMCGASRPGHFRGVATVVTKLFNLVLPDVAVFGQKDAQQALVIRELVEQLAMPVELLLAPIQRERDGLALSSRNRYLDGRQREAAPAVYASLKQALRRVEQGERNAGALRAFVRSELEARDGVVVEYVELRNAGDLSALDSVTGKVILAVAVRVGSTRLIDNAVFCVETDGTVRERLLFGEEI
jgi:pantoate--beta-alanine ligase